MKRAHILVLMLACAVLHAVVANADHSGPQSASASSQSSTQAMSSDRRDDGRAATSARAKAQTSKQTTAKAQTQTNATAKAHLHSSAGVNSPNPADRVSNGREPVSRGNSADLGQESQSHGVSPAKGATIPTATVSNALPAPPSSVASHAAKTPDISRHRDPNPPVINGLVNSKTQNSAAINGTGLHRKP